MSTRVQNAVLGCNLKNNRMIPVHFQGKPFNITVNQVYAPTSNVEEAEAEWFYEDLQDLLELKPQKRCPFHHSGLECKSRKSRIHGVTGKFGLGVQNEAVQGLKEFCQENILIIKHSFSRTQEKTLHRDITRCSIPKIGLIMFNAAKDGETL